MIHLSKLVSPEKRERLARDRAEFEAASVPIRALRTDAFTGIERTVLVRLLPDGEWLKMHGGVTGYESIRISELDQAIEAGGWLACFGTEKKWDRLFIAGEELGLVAIVLRERSKEAP